MTMFRQVQLRRMEGENAESTLDLNSAPYSVAAGGWRSEGERLEIGVVIEATTLTALDRAVNAIWRMLAQAQAYAQRTNGQPIYVFTKTCDSVSATTEFGATWMRKAITTGTLSVPDPSLLADGHFTVTVTVTLEVAALWERALVAAIAEWTTGSSGVTTDSGGGLTVTNTAATLYAPRLRWTSTTGLTVRTFWRYRSNFIGSPQLDLLRLSANFRAYVNQNTKLFVIGDETGIVASSPAQTLVDGEVYEVVVRMAGSDSGVWLDGTRIVSHKSALSWPANPETYRLIETQSTCGGQTFQSIQVWPEGLTNAEITGMAGWGAPESELCYLVDSGNAQLTNSYRYLYNVPGDALAPVRVVMSGSASFDQVRAHLRLLSAPAASKWECESGTLGANTASNSNSDASNGSQARFTPADTAWATRVTLVLAADPNDVDDIWGRHRVFLAGYDSAASTNINQVRWRVVIAGVAEAWSDAVSLAAVSTRSLVDLGTLDIPPGAWPDETQTATSDVVGGSYVTLEIQASNTTGSGGGTLDLDALYLAPAEIETEVACADFDYSDEFVVIDFASRLLNAITVRNWRTMEFATWGSLTGDRLELAPRTGLAAFLWMYAYRDSSEQAMPKDTASLFLFYRPMWVR